MSTIIFQTESAAYAAINEAATSFFDHDCTMSEVFMMHIEDLDQYYWSSDPDTRDNFDCPDATGWPEWRVRRLALEDPDGEAARAVREADRA